MTLTPLTHGGGGGEGNRGATGKGEDHGNLLLLVILRPLNIKTKNTYF